MNNQNTLTSLTECETELSKMKAIIGVFGQAHEIVPFLTNYALIRSCGTIEYCFKLILTEYHSSNTSAQAKNYINSTFFESSMNPTLENIHKSLNNFDSSWNLNFKSLLNSEPNSGKLKSSISSLNSLRNDLAHGRMTSGISFSEIEGYFLDCKRIIELLDQVVC